MPLRRLRIPPSRLLGSGRTPSELVLLVEDQCPEGTVDSCRLRIRLALLHRAGQSRQGSLGGALEDHRLHPCLREQHEAVPCGLRSGGGVCDRPPSPFGSDPPRAPVLQVRGPSDVGPHQVSSEAARSRRPPCRGPLRLGEGRPRLGRGHDRDRLSRVVGHRRAHPHRSGRRCRPRLGMRMGHQADRPLQQVRGLHRRRSRGDAGHPPVRGSVPRPPGFHREIRRIPPQGRRQARSDGVQGFPEGIPFDRRFGDSLPPAQGGVERGGVQGPVPGRGVLGGRRPGGG